VERLLAEARLRLVETGTRNRLVHTPRGAKRTRSLSILDADADRLFQALGERKSMSFLPGDPETTGSRSLASTRSPVRANGNLLQTSLELEKLEKRLLSIYRDAKTAEEEQGINILFLAIGFLRWYEDDKSDVLREAPLLLLPVALTRDTKNSTFELCAREDDIATNQAIQERLRSDFGILLPEIPDAEDWLPSAYFDAVRDVIATKARWSIDRAGVELGFYSFAKLLMIRDLEPEAWTDKSILEHKLLRGLLSEGFREERLPYDDQTKLDQIFSPANLIQVVDADSSQTIVIETVRAGRNLVVQGPPGTGKSQTITNIIASAVHDGKSVLFVAEKMAALDVVQSRLNHVGLGPICLELHSRSANKKAVLAELEETLLYHAAEPNARAETARLTELRDSLNAFAESLHAPVPGMGATGHETLGRLVAATEKGVTSHAPLIAEAAKWTHGVYVSVRESASSLIELTASAGPMSRHPYYGIEALNLQPMELARLNEPLAALADTAARLAERSEALAQSLGVASGATLECCGKQLAILKIVDNMTAEVAEVARSLNPQQIGRIVEAAQAGATLNDLRASYADTFADAAWDAPTADLRTQLASGLSFFWWLSSDYRKGSRILASLLKISMPKKAQEQIELVDKLIAAGKAREAFKAEDEAMAAILPVHWRGEKTDFIALHEAATTVQTLFAHPDKPHIQNVIDLARRNAASRQIGELTDEVEAFVRSRDDILGILNVDLSKAFQIDSPDQIPLRSLGAKAHLWRNEQARFDEWRRLAAEDARLRTRSGAVLADALAKGVLPADKASAVLDCTHAEAIWTQALKAQPKLQQFHGTSYDLQANEFRQLEAKRRRTSVDIVRGRHAAKIPHGDYGSMAIIRSEIKRKRGHMPLRKLFRSAGETLLRIKPVLLMSPISVAQFLAPGAIEFDLLVIDEASQVRPEDALGLVARTKQIVVVGDNKQLPPTSFFDRVMADEEESDDEDDALGGAAKATDLESILALCEARGLNSAMLRWHYRSRHPSLIEVSNAEFYKRLVMPPAPSAERSNEGLILRRVNGAYDRGGKRINLVEAEAVANAVAEHARTSSDLSLGVVTFSTVQRDAINDLLEQKRRTDQALDAFLHEGGHEDVFVKNLENVQGDERDVILISVGYGPRIASARLDSMSFGPVSAEGGERRLNVLFTRARSRCVIFCSFSAGDIDPERAKGEGARVLKRFLQFAETGFLEEQVSTSEDADSPFEEAVASIIESMGYKADKQVGSSGFRIDLAVRHPDQPGRYMLAVECDGATYHGALWARERDRLRQEVLENMGWRFHRIWSTDWFYRRGEAIQKLKAALDAAKAAAPSSRPKQTARVPTPPASPTGVSVKSSASAQQVPAYRICQCAVPRNVEPHQVETSVMARVTREVVETEGPIHQDEVARRVTALFGKLRTGALISEASLKSLIFLKASNILVEESRFWMTPEQLVNPPVRDRSSASVSQQKADMLSPREIRAAARIAKQENGELTEDEMALAITRLIGFKRTGPDLKAAIVAALSDS
jgi:very-short-patch-repair endonuclease